MGFEPKRDEVRRMIAESDRDGSGTISFDTFQSVMANKMHDATRRRRRSRPSACLTTTRRGRSRSKTCAASPRSSART